MRKTLCAVAVTTLAVISLAQAASSIKGVQNELLSYEKASGQVGIVGAIANQPMFIPDVKGTPVRWDWDRRRRRDRDSRGGRGDRRRETTRMISCYSHADRYERCDTGLSEIWNISVHQISRARCRRYDTWGLDGTAIWVDHGCRADFQVTGLN